MKLLVSHADLFNVYVSMRAVNKMNETVEIIKKVGDSMIFTSEEGAELTVTMCPGDQIDDYYETVTLQLDFPTEEDSEFFLYEFEESMKEYFSSAEYEIELDEE